MISWSFLGVVGGHLGKEAVHVEDAVAVETLST
jgi:hypothetical protein